MPAPDTLPTIYEENDAAVAVLATVVREWLAVLESSAGAGAAPPRWPTLQTFAALPVANREHWCALIVYVGRHAATRRRECAGHMRAFLDWLLLRSLPPT